MRECKCTVSIEGQLGGEKYAETFITQGRCADHAVGKVHDHVTRTYKTLTGLKVRFKDWFNFDSDMKVDIP